MCTLYKIVLKIAIILPLQYFVSCKESNDSTIRRYIKRYYQNINRNEYVQAVKQIDKAIQLDSNRHELYFLRGRANVLLKDFDLAIKDYSISLRQNPLSIAAYFYRGAAYSLNDSEQLAISDFNKALEIKTRNGLIYDINNQGDPIYGIEKDISSSKIKYNRALSFYSIHSDSLALLDFSHCVQAKYELGESLFYTGVIELSYGNKDKACYSLGEELKLGEEGAKEYINKYCSSN